jgi:predicted nuclease of predicted toxin-antitoxin system
MISFLADEHIPFTTIRILRESGYKVVSISEDRPSVDDDMILRLANAEGLVLITNDGDFGDLIFRDKVPFSSGLIYFRLDRFDPEEMAKLILYHIREYGAEFKGRFTVISRRKFRQRDL